ncbi:hypothetical protein PHYSODRAFT_565522 [Phytophthora sojae]|uniref:Uncharacterized protein n=1 Tax=Phytophthora sojae (strain P6497) TaxID=1094619 RepID=G5AAM9_PHYSP|nr:hypothetical protein PHYSODRAFT_565522 [Phytophthora sojae]EGZ07658.1 hypothetical protein PHYSODRAFT_565522 [Phytophthora sojae]|eukprot:XP_009537224.1 hypothetical protein PHYSODRAFT_565522 [Phytophthora sojae]
MNSYARFTVSDTTGSARNVSDHFENTDQVDCLCLLYGLGLKENTRQDGACTVPPGGKFEEGLRVVKMLPIDAKTRVGYAVTLLRRSVYNYFAFAKYFDTATSTEQATWVNIADADWELIIKMGAVTNQLAQFSLGEVQKEGVSSSYVLLFRKILAITLDMQRFPCLVQERPDPFVASALDGLYGS